MDFRSRGVQTPIAQAASTSSVGSQDSGKKGLSKLFSKGPILLLILIALMVAAVAAFTVFGGGGQSKLVEKSKYQAVFLNNGQVYFGHIQDLNDKYVNLDSIYYLQTNNAGADAQAAAANQNVTLVKLGCELHGPFDQMVINADQVLFWENLKDNSQVVTKIAEYNKTNPKHECTAAASGTTNQAAPNATTQSTGNTGTSTQPSGSNSGSGTTTTPRQP